MVFAYFHHIVPAYVAMSSHELSAVSYSFSGGTYLNHCLVRMMWCTHSTTLPRCAHAPPQTMSRVQRHTRGEGDTCVRSSMAA